MNIVFKDARREALIPMLDTIIKIFSAWFNKHRQDSVSGSIDTKLVPLVEIHLHKLWGKDEITTLRELNSYVLEYEITEPDDGNLFGELNSEECYMQGL